MRNITENDVKNARRLSHLWHTRKTELNLTQEAAADSLKVTQSAVSHMLRAKMALTTDLVLAWAKLLEVQPSAIAPDVGKKVAFIGNEKRISRRICILNSSNLSKPIKENIETLVDSNHTAYGVEVSDNNSGLDSGDVVILDPEKIVRIGSKVAIRTNKLYAFGKLVRRDDLSITITQFNDEEVTFLRNSIWHVHGIAGIEYV